MKVIVSSKFGKWHIPHSSYEDLTAHLLKLEVLIVFFKPKGYENHLRDLFFFLKSGFLCMCAKSLHVRLFATLYP